LEPARPSFAKEFIRRFTPVLILLGLSVILTILNPDFLTASNLINVVLQGSILAIVAIGQTYVMLTAGIDLSVGSLVALGGALAAGLAVKAGLGTYPAILVTLLVGALLGGVSGLLVVKGNIPPFVSTLSMMAIARSLMLVYTQGKPIAGLGEDFTFWGTGVVLGIPMPVVVMVVVASGAALLLNQTRFGLYTRAVGGGEETLRLAGVKTGNVKLAVYVISGILATLGGILLTARLWSAQPSAGTGMELDAIAASVLGGTSLMGGVGSVGGAIIGALTIGVLSNGMNLLEVPSYYQQVVKGLVFVLAVLLDFATKGRPKND
jgi:ribose transport system permease protein